MLPRTAPSVPAAALLARAARAPCTFFAARAGEPAFPTAGAFVERFLARSAQVRIAAGEMRVILDAEHTDVAVRRARLDRDPGWLSWLRRTVRFHFKERR